MNAKLNRSLVLTAVIGLVCFTGLALAQPPEEGHKKFGGPPKEAMENFAKELELTPEQEAQIKQQREQQKKENQATREQLKAKNQELRQELDKATIDEAKVNSLVSEITALDGQKLGQRVEGVISMKKILTPEQQAKMKARMEERKKNWQEKKGGMRERIKERFFSK